MFLLIKLIIHSNVSKPYNGQNKNRVKLCMYDHHPKRSWFGRADLADLKIKIGFSGGDAVATRFERMESLRLYDYITHDKNMAYY